MHAFLFCILNMGISKNINVSLGEKPKVGFFLIEQAFFGKFCPGPIKRPAWNILEKLINVLSLIRASWVEQMLKINKIVLVYYSEL